MRLDGADFVAVVRIFRLPDKTLAFPGQTCENVPAELLEIFEHRGRIKRIEKKIQKEWTDV